MTLSFDPRSMVAGIGVRTRILVLSVLTLLGSFAVLGAWSLRNLEGHERAAA